MSSTGPGSSFAGTLPAALGQATMANSLPVALASNQSNVPENMTQFGGVAVFTELASLTAGSLNADLIPSTDVSAYRSATIQITGTWTGTLTFQGSNDNVNFVSILHQDITATNAASGSTLTANGFRYIFLTGFRYLRVRMTAYTSGTANAVAEFSITYNPPQNIVATLQSLASASQGQTSIAISAAVGPQTPFRTTDANTTGQVVKASTGVIGAIHAYNNAATVRYLKIYDKATAALSSDTPNRTIGLPANSMTNIVYVFTPRFLNGIGIRCTTGLPDNDTGAPTANDVMVTMDFS